jgi:cellulose synthase/poly-beta-1,6-N-acetylglucosamine synthase-like glycosyltransferase
VIGFILVTAIALVNLVTALAAFRRVKVPPLRIHPSVTIICRTWDDDHIVERFLKSCLDQDYPGKIEIILADDASSDGTPEIAKRYREKIRYVRAKKHHGWKAHFLNPILKKVKSDILVNTDIDAVLPRNYVSEMVRHLQKYDAVSSECVGGNPVTSVAKTRIVEDIWLFGTGMKGRNVLTGSSALYGGSHAIWMKVLRDVGYYGTKTITEDAELTVMLNGKGYTASFCDSMVVLLEDVESLGHYLNERKRWLQGTIDVAGHYGGLQAYNYLFLANMLFSTTSLVSLVAAVFSPPFVLPLLMNLLTHVLSLAKFRAKPRVYLWVSLYIFLDPLLELAALLGILRDRVSGRGVRWVKVSGKKYHVGSPLKPVYNTKVQ